MLLQNVKRKRFSLLSAKEVAMTIPGIICHLQESHSGTILRSPALVPNCRQLPKAVAASSHAAIFAPGTAAGSLHAPEQDAPNAASPRGSRCPGGSWAPGTGTGCCLQSQLPQVSSQRDREAVPSLLRRASRRAPGARRGAAGCAGGGRGGGGQARGGGGPGGGGAGARPQRYLSPNNVATRGVH